MDHVVIRDAKFVAGSYEKPEVKIFVQTDIRKRPIDEDKIQVNDTVWMKWSGGPVVAKSKIASFHSGNVLNSEINKLRELTVGTSLFGLDNYWNEIISKKNFYFTVIRLKNEEWVEKIFYPKTRSYGSSWIYLDTEQKRNNWLINVKNTQIRNKEGSNRKIPAGLRFDVLRRDNFTCKYCGRKAPNVKLHVDHLIPYKIIREHTLENLVTSCKDCNLGKSDKLI